MDWMNTEGRLIMVKIFDALGGEPGTRPFNIEYTIENNGDGTMNVEFAFDPLPVDTISVTIYYLLDGTATGGSVTPGIFSPINMTIPWQNNWHFIFVIHSASPPDHVIDMNTLYSQVEDLTPSGIAFELSVIDNDEDLHKVVRAKQAVFRFLSTANLSLKLFTGPRSFDFRYYVTVEADEADRFLFKGFLILDDLSEPFLAPRNEVVLAATDRLGTLKNSNLVDFNNANPRGYNTIAKYLALALAKTGLRLNINVQMNIKEETSAPISGSALFSISGGTNFISVTFSKIWVVGRKIRSSNTVNNNKVFTVESVVNILLGYLITVTEAVVNEDASDALFEDTAGHMFNRVFIESKTFESNINESEKGYTVIEKLLGEGMFITEEKGEWWVKRLDETEKDHQQRITVFDSDGNFITDNDPVDYDKQVSRNDIISLVNNATTVQPTRPVKYVELIYKYSLPLEIICNIDWARGDFIMDLPDEADNDGHVQQVKKYGFECWQSLSKQGGGMPNAYQYYDQAQIAGVDLYVKKFYVNGTERGREFVIAAHSGSGAGVPYIKSEALEVHISDKISLSVDVFYSNIGGSTGYVNSPVMIGLFGDSGNIYWWKAYDITNPTMKQQWVQIPIGNLLQHFYLGASIEEPILNISFESPALPESGKLYVYLINQYGNSINAHYRDLNVSILAWINGSYKRITGQSNKVSQTQDVEQYNATRDKEVFISDSPRKNFKGAMFIYNGTSYQLAGLFYNANVFPGANIDLQFFHPYGQLQVFDVFNMYNRVFVKLRATLLGLSQDEIDSFGRADVPGLIHRFFINDSSPFAANKNFQLLSFIQDFENCTWTGLLREVWDTTIAKVYEGHEFKYIEK